MDQASYAARPEDLMPAGGAASGDGASGLATPQAPHLDPGLFKELVTHLVKREIDATHRMTVLGWAWPVTRQLVQLAVLSFIFGTALHFGNQIKHFPVFVFCGLIAWTWFSTGVGAAASSLLDQRHLLFQPRMPPAVLPIVAVAVPLVDVVMALPVLAVMLLVTTGIPWTVVFVPLLIVVQVVLMSGVAWLTSAGAVFMRDVPNIVAVSLTTLFYLTPVFYGLHTVPERYAKFLKLNPMATIVESWRALLLGGAYPGIGTIAYTLVLTIALAVGGFVSFRRVQHRFVDSL